MSLLLETTMKSNKMRLTKARKALYKILTQSESAFSAKEICDQLEGLDEVQSDPVSVYRNLAVFTEMGLAHKLSDGKYVACRSECEKNCSKHVHVISTCLDCGKAQEVSVPSTHADLLIKEIPGFKLLSMLSLQGKCEACLAN